MRTTNTGHYNTGNYNVGIFNTANGVVGAFNQPVDIPIAVLLKAVPSIHLPLVERVDGVLKTHTYKEAWATAWPKLSDSIRQRFLDLPNFDAAVFHYITGINVKEEAE